MPTKYTSQPGDDLASIAAAHGLASWKQIYDFDPNSALRDALKGDPNHLEPGTDMQLPDPPKFKVSDGNKLDIKMPAPDQVTLVLVLERSDRTPAKNCKYKLIISGNATDGSTDGNGKLECPLDPAAPKGSLTFWPEGDDEDPEECEVHFGQIGPAKSVSGAQARLANLGYYFGGIDGNAGPLTQTAAGDFQHDEELDETGKLDDDTKSAIGKRHDGTS
jgi:hypothetical protein